MQEVLTCEVSPDFGLMICATEIGHGISVLRYIDGEPCYRITVVDFEWRKGRLSVWLRVKQLAQARPLNRRLLAHRLVISGGLLEPVAPIEIFTGEALVDETELVFEVEGSCAYVVIPQDDQAEARLGVRFMRC